MAPNRGRNRAADFDNLLDAGAADHDPEVDDFPDGSSDSEDEVEGEEEAAREHYVEVGKSKLRKPKDAPLGPQYRGSKISRDAVREDEDEDDPFGRGFDEEESMDGEDDAVDAASEVSDDEDEDAEEETPDTDISGEDEETARPNNAAFRPTRQDDVKLAMRDTSTVANMLSQASQADAEKGRAVKKQRRAFDSLLGTRMKLQKALIATNTVSGTSQEDLNDQRADAKGAIQAAETAAFNLWSSLNDFREELLSARTGDKRKRSFSITTPTSQLWSHMQAQEADNIERRNATLQKWSKKTQESTGVSQRSSLLNGNTPQTTVLDVIQQHLSDSARLMKRARTPRSCAPLQLANKVTEDERIYDDADFYGLMLKELLEAKSADSLTTSNVDLSFQMRREAKTKKNIDTKASKGRKLRYTVHEKLQNFMAPEDRGAWGERQTDELFGSLFGQQSGLREDVGEEVDGALDDGVMDEAEAGLMMFRS